MKKSSEEFKQLQRDRINKTKPWIQSTGPKTPQGKKKSSVNARKGDFEVNRLIKMYRNIMKNQKELQNMIMQK